MRNRKVPLFVKYILAVVVMGSLFVIILSITLAGVRSREEQRDCDRSVEGRMDNRAMWLWLGEEFSGSGPDAESFLLRMRAELDDRLEQTVCVNRNPVPISEVEN